MSFPLSMVERALVSVVSLAMPVALLAGAPASSAHDSGAHDSSAHQSSTIYQHTFEKGVRGWSTSRKARIEAVDRGRRSDRAARLRTKSRGAVTRTKVRESVAPGTHQVASAWLRSTRGRVRAHLVVREVHRATGDVLVRERKAVKVRQRWRRAKVGIVRQSADSVLTVEVRTRQARRDRVLLDTVRVRRKAAGQPGPNPGPAPVPDPAPAPEPGPSGEFPNAANTGVPAGVALSGYSGPTTVTTAGAVIDAMQVNGALHIKAPNVKISRSHVTGNIVVEPQGSLTITDSVVDAGTFNGSAVGQYNITMKRVEVIGARQSVSCNANCDVQDSWLHAQYIKPGSDWHGDGFISNGGSNMLLRHNTLACDSKPTGAGGACSAALAAFGDFAPIENLTVDNNLFVSSPASYCMYAGYDPNKPHGRSPRNVVVTDNVFERGASGKCAAFGPVTAVAPAGNGNVFSGNTWVDGTAITR